MPRKSALMQLKENDRKIRQQLIIDAARDLFGQKTYDTVSMAEIAQAAGMAKSSIYTYFKSQEALYSTIACQDTLVFIKGLESRVRHSREDPVQPAIDYFLSYYIANESQWKMITHLALHGTAEMKTNESLNQAGRQLMTVFEQIFQKLGSTSNSRLMAHTLFACLSGILIAFRKYPGRTEADRLVHMNRIGSILAEMIHAFFRMNQ